MIQQNNGNNDENNYKGIIINYKNRICIDITERI